MNGDVAVPGGLTAGGHRAGAARSATTLRGEPIDLCVTSEFERARSRRRTRRSRGRDAAAARAARAERPALRRVTRAKQLDEYRAWAGAAPPRRRPGAGARADATIVDRYARAFRTLLDRPEETILVVAHSLPIAYALARPGRASSPAARVPLVPSTRRRIRSRLTSSTRVVGVLERWLAAPSW